jgi:hypothetical protein
LGKYQSASLTVILAIMFEGNGQDGAENHMGKPDEEIGQASNPKQFFHEGKLLLI